MAELDQTKALAILQILHESGSVVSSAEIASTLHAQGYDTSPRTVRYYLQKMQEQNLVEAAARGRKGGSRILPLGISELKSSRTVERVGFMQANIDLLSYEMDFDPSTQRGKVVMNLSILDLTCLDDALKEIDKVFSAGLSMGEYLSIFPPGTSANSTVIPQHKIGIGTVCSVTVNGALLKAGIPTVSRLGGNLEVSGYQPQRFTELIAYDGTTLDPLEIFIKAKLTQVRKAVTDGTGTIGASFREVPTCALNQVKLVQEKLDRIGLGGMLFIGPPNQNFLDVPVSENRTGLIVVGGLNPIAAVEEKGYPTVNRALTMLSEFSDLAHYRDARRICREAGLLRQ